MPPASTAPTATDGANLPAGENDDDENKTNVKRTFKHLPVPKFTGTQDDWDDWSYKFESICAGLDDRLCLLMKVSEVHVGQFYDLDCETWELGDEGIKPKSGEPDAVKLSRELHQQLVANCNGQAATLVKTNRLMKNGFETWRLLYQHYSVRNAAKSRMMMQKILNFKLSKDDYKQFLTDLTSWEALMLEYDDLTKEKMKDYVKMAHLIDKCPETVADHLNLHPEISEYNKVSLLVKNFEKQI
jgi:hypothetical protein